MSPKKVKATTTKSMKGIFVCRRDFDHYYSKPFPISKHTNTTFAEIMNVLK